MLIKDQLRVRMEQLKISVPELADRVGVSNQSVRHWLSGRNAPTKRHIPDLEKALSMRLDFSEGDTHPSTPTVEATLQQNDIELFLLVQRMPPEIKIPLTRFIQAIVDLAKRGSLPVMDLPSAGVKHSPARQAPRAAAR